MKKILLIFIFFNYLFSYCQNGLAVNGLFMKDTVRENEILYLRFLYQIENTNQYPIYLWIGKWNFHFYDLCLFGGIRNDAYGLLGNRHYGSSIIRNISEENLFVLSDIRSINEGYEEYFRHEDYNPIIHNLGHCVKEIAPCNSFYVVLWVKEPAIIDYCIKNKISAYCVIRTLSLEKTLLNDCKSNFYLSDSLIIKKPDVDLINTQSENLYYGHKYILDTIIRTNFINNCKLKYQLVKNEYWCE